MDILFTEHFKKQIKRLKKKYPHVKNDLLAKIELSDWKKEIPIGRSILKIRIGSKDMRRGKSGGFRSYIYAYTKKNKLIPLCIYAKSESESITENELHYHLMETMKEILGL
jgi:mRNA-degrading endonuclease RelE of RelBE toxin-antitoxin system